MLRFHRIASAVALALVTAALHVPAAQARSTLAGGEQGPAPRQTILPRVEGGHETGGVDWSVALAGAAGSTIVIAMGAAAVGLVRRRTLTA